MTILSGEQFNVELLYRESLILTADSTTTAAGNASAVHGSGANRVIVKGDVGTAGHAMDFDGTNNIIAITAQGSVEGESGAIRLIAGYGSQISNAGTIASQGIGIETSANAYAAGCLVVNSGTIVGGSYALRLADGDDRVINTGLLSGRAALGQGDDLFDSSQGVLGGDQVYGDAGNDTLIGSAYADWLVGGLDDDELWGGNGNDKLDGGGGGDELHGGAGFDVARYESAAAGVVANLGNPAANTRDARGDSYDSIEGLVGSTSGDRLTGDDNRNLLDGLGGADILTGLGGNDVYRVDHVNDRVIEVAGGGVDTVVASLGFSLAGTDVENLYLGANTDGLTARGNGLANTLRGGNGGDTLAGDLGRDTLTGGAGFDNFRFDSAPGPTNFDTITDFDRTDDQIWLDLDIFTALGGQGTHLPDNEFRLGTRALDTDDHILYDRATGAIRYDADGSGAGAAVLFALLEPGTLLTASDVWAVL